MDYSCTFACPIPWCAIHFSVVRSLTVATIPACAYLRSVLFKNTYINNIGLYWKTATEGGNHTNDWLIVLDGGGICTHKDDCTKRANTSLGSSKFFTPTFNFSSIAFTTDDKRNPFKDWYDYELMAPAPASFTIRNTFFVSPNSRRWRATRFFSSCFSWVPPLPPFPRRI